MDTVAPRTHLRSHAASQASMRSPALTAWGERLRQAWDLQRTGRPIPLNRKLWEWFFIAAALDDHGLLRPGARGLGFGVGREPLAALFASMGCEIVATDQDSESARAGGWDDGTQYAGSTSHLNDHGLCDPVSFERLVSFRAVDMRAIPADLKDFDFTWSSCAMEHLGSLAAGEEFVRQQMRCLRPGGVGVHTTELNVDSDDETIGDGATVLYRRSDLRGLAAGLAREGHRVDLDLSLGDTPEDIHVDAPPWPGPHLRIRVGDHVTTSFGLIVQKSWSPEPLVSKITGRVTGHFRDWRRK